MPSIYTMEGTRSPRRRRGSTLERGECKRVPSGKKKNCTIELCNTGRGKTKHQFTKGSTRCGR